MSGTWSGTYNGSFVGKFKLTLQQTGPALSGSITLSAPSETLDVSGTVSGNTISFGTLGSTDITYSGKIAGSMMAGSYSVNGAPGGDWTATKAP